MPGTRNLLLAATIATTTALLGACGTTLSQQVARDMSAQSDEYQAWWNQQIVYHRDTNVYFSPLDREYYYFENGQWQQASILPARITLGYDDVSFVKRSKLLTITGNSTGVMAFNPYYDPSSHTPATPDEDTMPMLTEADADAIPATSDEGASPMLTEADADASPATSATWDEDAMQTTLVEENE